MQSLQPLGWEKNIVFLHYFTPYKWPYKWCGLWLFHPYKWSFYTATYNCFFLGGPFLLWNLQKWNDFEQPSVFSLFHDEKKRFEEPSVISVIRVPSLWKKKHPSEAMGLQLQELYVAPRHMTSLAWDILAEGLRWARQHARILRDSHWAFGDVANREVYWFLEQKQHGCFQK